MLDGGKLYGVNCTSSGDVFSEDASFRFAEWPFGGDGEPTRAEAFAAAVKSLQIDDGAPLALPPDMLVSRVITLPATDQESLSSMVRLEMEKFAPVADSDLVVGFEAIWATENETRVFAVAAPSATLDALASDLEESGLAVTRIDSSLLCEWRSISKWQDIRAGNGRGDSATKDAEAAAGDVWIVALESGRFDFFASDRHGPVFARTMGSIAAPADLTRETTLSLLDLALENVGFDPCRFHIVFAGTPKPEFADAVAKAALASPLETIPCDSIQDFARSALEREEEEGCIDIVPPAWREDEKAAQTRRNFAIGAGAAVAVWAILFAVLQAIPRMILRDTAAIRREIAATMPQYGEVSDLRARVRLIDAYADRSRSAIEILRILCERMPDDMVLTSFAYENGDDSSDGKARKDPGGVKVSGDAASGESILLFKDEVDGLGMFQAARLVGPNNDRSRGRFKFDLDWRFAEDAQWR